MNRKFAFIGLLILGLMTFLGVALTHAATFDVDMGDTAPPCGGSNPADIGFVDCTSNTGGILATAMTSISPGDTVRWTMRTTPHTVTTEAALTGGPAAACGTGDLFDSGVTNAFTLGFVYTHTFSTPGTCTYFCFIHPTTMFGQVNVASPPPTTTTSTTSTTAPSSTTSTTTTTTTSTCTCGTTSTTTTTTTISTTTTTTCNDQNKGQDKGKGKGHVKGRCKGHDKDK